MSEETSRPPNWTISKTFTLRLRLVPSGRGLVGTVQMLQSGVADTPAETLALENRELTQSIGERRILDGIDLDLPYSEVWAWSASEVKGNPPCLTH